MLILQTSKTKTTIQKFTQIKIQKCFYPKVPSSKDLVKIVPKNRPPVSMPEDMAVQENSTQALQRNAVGMPKEPSVPNPFTKKATSPQIVYSKTPQIENKPVATSEALQHLAKMNISTKKTVPEAMTTTFEMVPVTSSSANIQSQIRVSVFDLTSDNIILDILKNAVINNDKIPNEDIKKLLHRLKENNTPFKEDSLLALRKYFKNNPASNEQKLMVIQIYKESNIEFVALDFKLSTIAVVEKTKTDNKKKDASDNKMSFDEKKQEASRIIYFNTNKFLEFLKTYEDDPIQILSSKELKEWYEQQKNRTNIVPFQDLELKVYEIFKEILDNYAPKENELLERRKDILKPFKNQSNLPEVLKQEPLGQCILPEDFDSGIAAVSLGLSKLQNDINLSLVDIKLLAINSGAATIDAEGTFKLTQKAYKSFAENSEFLGFKYLNSKPQLEYILNKIKNKDYFIAEEKIDNKRQGIVDLAHESHKTLVIYDENLGKNVFVRMGLVTSTKDEGTIKIDDYQQTNTDPEKQNKDQMFRILSNFMVVEEVDDLIIDLENTLLFRSKNSKGEDVGEFLFKEFQRKANIWSKNNYQSSYEADKQFLSKLAIIFYKKSLQELEEAFKNLTKELHELKIKDNEAFDNKILELEEIKQQGIADKKAQLYFSLLPDEWQDLFSSLKLYEKRKKKDENKEKKRAQKEKVKKDMDNFKNDKNKKEDIGEVKEKTAKEKKEDYLKSKQYKD